MTMLIPDVRFLHVRRAGSSVAIVGDLPSTKLFGRCGVSSTRSALDAHLLHVGPGVAADYVALRNGGASLGGRF